MIAKDNAKAKHYDPFLHQLKPLRTESPSLTQAMPMNPSSQSNLRVTHSLDIILIPTNTVARMKKTSVTANTASLRDMVGWRL